LAISFFGIHKWKIVCSEIGSENSNLSKHNFPSSHLGVRNILWWGGGGGGGDIKLKYFPLCLQNLNLIGYLISPLWEIQGRMDGGGNRKQTKQMKMEMCNTVHQP
jgi:hypothetical protein